MFASFLSRTQKKQKKGRRRKSEKLNVKLAEVAYSYISFRYGEKCGEYNKVIITTKTSSAPALLTFTPPPVAKNCIVQFSYLVGSRAQ